MPQRPLSASNAPGSAGPRRTQIIKRAGVSAALGALLLLAALYLAPGWSGNIGSTPAEIDLRPAIPGQGALLIPDNNWGWSWPTPLPLAASISTDNPIALSQQGSGQWALPALLAIVPLLAIIAIGAGGIMLIDLGFGRRVLFWSLGWLAAGALAIAGSYLLFPEPQFLGRAQQSEQLWALYQDYRQPVPAISRYEIPGQELLFPEQYLAPATEPSR